MGLSAAHPLVCKTASMMSNYSGHADLRAALSDRDDVSVSVEVPLSQLSRWRIGGPAKTVIEPKTEAGLIAGLAAVRNSGLPCFIVGDGSNVLFDDAGFHGVIVRIGRTLADVRIEGRRVTAQAGAWTPQFARQVGAHGLTGIEHTVGIPGTLGGLIVMNGGSQRKGIGDHVVSVTTLDFAGNRRVFDKSSCAFAYRTSALQGGGLITVSAELELEEGDPAAIRREMIEIMSSRRKKFPLRLPNCGSVFLSNPMMYDTVGPPGRAIEEVGLRGHRIGDAQIAPGHGNFIVNVGQASSADVLALIRLIRQRVYDRTAFWMECEVRYVSPDGLVVPAHEIG